MAQESSAIVTGLARLVTIESISGAPPEQKTARTQFRVDSVEGKGSSNLVGTEITIYSSVHVASSTTSPITLLRRDTSYVLFLAKDAPEEGTYYVLDGVGGRFVIRDGKVYKYCGQPGVGEFEATGEGQGQSLATFLIQVRTAAAA